jgi:hypothetical protein
MVESNLGWLIIHAGMTLSELMIQPDSIIPILTPELRSLRICFQQLVHTQIQQVMMYVIRRELLQLQGWYRQICSKIEHNRYLENDDFKIQGNYVR